MGKTGKWKGAPDMNVDIIDQDKKTQEETAVGGVLVKIKFSFIHNISKVKQVTQTSYFFLHKRSLEVDSSGFA